MKREIYGKGGFVDEELGGRCEIIFAERGGER